MSRPLRVYVLEDEPAARQELLFLLYELTQLEVGGHAGDGHTALRELQTLRPDVALLDVQVPGPSGMAVAEQLRLQQPELQVVFVTAYDEYAVRAFALAATDYLLKPYEPERVAAALERARQTMQRAEQPQRGPLRLRVERRRQQHFLPVHEVAWVAMEGGLVTVAARDGTRYGSEETLRTLEQRLSGKGFFRCHRGAIVQVARIRALKPHSSGTYRVCLDDAGGSELRVARNRVAALRALLPR